MARFSRGDVRSARDRKSTRLNSSHANISYAVFCLKKNKKAEVAVLKFSQIPAVLDRAKGLKEGIQKFAPNDKFVAETDANNRETGMKAAYNIIQANPTVNVFFFIINNAVPAASYPFPPPTPLRI